MPSPSEETKPEPSLCKRLMHVKDPTAADKRLFWRRKNTKNCTNVGRILHGRMGVARPCRCWLYSGTTDRTSDGKMSLVGSVKHTKGGGD